MLHTSTGLPYGSWAKTSRETYDGVPHANVNKLSPIKTERPKSEI